MTRRLLPALLLLSCAVGAAFAAAAANAEETPLTVLPYSPSLDVRSMDRGIDPCVDFYQYSCGGWMKANPIPADQASWSVFRKLGQDNQRYLWGILDGYARKASGRNATQQKIGDYFASCMDEAAVEKLGARPLAPHFARIDAMKSKAELPAVLGALHLAPTDSGLFFGFTSNQDFGDSSRVIAWAEPGGLGLPDRDYYVKDDARSKEIREKYLAHVAQVFALLGQDVARAKVSAERVLAFETALAQRSFTRVERRDPNRLHNVVDAKGLQALTPTFDWRAYQRALGIKPLDTFNVSEPDFYRELARQLERASLEDMKTYMRWHVARSMAPYLSSDHVNANFEFFSKALRGVPQLRPRWKRCVALVDRDLGEALGQEFVRRTFSPQVKEDVLRMTRRIERAMEEDIKSLDWMSPATKERALEKLHAVVNKIGYPDKWRDYSPVVIRRGDFLGNVDRATRFETKRVLAKIGKPVDRGEWYMTPPSVNAYYNAQTNDINFAAGVLQPPLFDPKMDAAPNYGNTGGTIGHELTHGFDDEGRQYDAKGNLRDWWGKEDAAAFNERAQCIADQYATYTVVDDIKINSTLTLGEDVADLGGLVLAYMAWKAEVAGVTLEDRDGLTPDQRFFVGYAQWACENDRPENARVTAITDPHSPGRWRVNGLVVNMPEFARAFSCKPGHPMVAEKRCRVW
jgi:putative endopeptidase